MGLAHIPAVLPCMIPKHPASLHPSAWVNPSSPGLSTEMHADAPEPQADMWVLLVSSTEQRMEWFLAHCMLSRKIGAGCRMACRLVARTAVMMRMSVDSEDAESSVIAIEGIAGKACTASASPETEKDTRHNLPARS